MGDEDRSAALEDKVFSSKASGAEFDHLIDQWMESRKAWQGKAGESMEEMIKKRIAHLSAQVSGEEGHDGDSPSDSPTRPFGR